MSYNKINCPRCQKTMTFGTKKEVKEFISCSECDRFARAFLRALAGVLEMDDRPIALALYRLAELNFKFVL